MSALLSDSKTLCLQLISWSWELHVLIVKVQLYNALLLCLILTLYRLQLVKPVRLALDLNVGVAILDVNAQELVEHLVKLAELWTLTGGLAPAVKHDVIAIVGEKELKVRVKANKRLLQQ